MHDSGPNPDVSRAETITAALLYLMTHYARTGCPDPARKRTRIPGAPGTEDEP